MIWWPTGTKALQMAKYSANMNDANGKPHKKKPTKNVLESQKTEAKTYNKQNKCCNHRRWKQMRKCHK